jgi:hypothetical protein
MPERVFFKTEVLFCYDSYDVEIEVRIESGNRLLLPWSKPSFVVGSGAFPFLSIPWNLSHNREKSHETSVSVDTNSTFDVTA